MNKYKELERRQLLKKIQQFSAFPLSYTRPADGWIRTLRKALGMTGLQLSKRLNVNQSRISEIERAELEDQLSIKTLRKIANSLGCRLEYVFIPETPLETLLEERALMIAKEKVKYVSQQMALEDQALSDIDEEVQIRKLADELLKTPKKLWDI